MSKSKRLKQVVSSLNIIDDTLFQKMAEDIGFCEELLASCITANITDPGVKFEKVPTVISVFISKFDMFHKKKII